MSGGRLGGILIPIFLVGALVAGGVWYRAVAKDPAPSQVTACDMDARLCPDGSTVGRIGPNCDFAACPASEPSTFECTGPNDSCPSGYTCIERCGPPVARENDPAPGYYCERDAVASQPRICPICLASNTMIDTPDGLVSVKDVKIGMSVWTADSAGRRAKSEVIDVSKTSVSETHQVTHLILTDGREVWVSPGHPTADGRRTVDLRVGDPYDGSMVSSAETEPYWDTATYDLLPAGESGQYWANGVLLGSTLASSRAAR